jgi:putative tryptophan/tyrosine transport system substrate-binding protein
LGAVYSAQASLPRGNAAHETGSFGMSHSDAPIGIPMDRSAGEPEYQQAFETMARQSVQALMANGLPPNFEHRDLILELAVKYRLPSITWWTDISEQICLAYTPDYPYYFHLWADEVGQALNGVAPADIPIHRRRSSCSRSI